MGLLLIADRSDVRDLELESCLFEHSVLVSLESTSPKRS